MHNTLRGRPADRLAEEREAMRPLRARAGHQPSLDVRVPPNPYLRFDTNDYSLHPSVVGRRVEVRATQREITAVVPDTGELACGHQRSFAEHRTITALEHTRVLRQRRGQRDDVVVDRRPLQRHDQLIAYAGPPSSRTCSARKAPAAARALPKLAERARDAD